MIWIIYVSVRINRNIYFKTEIAGNAWQEAVSVRINRNIYFNTLTYVDKSNRKSLSTNKSEY